MNDCKPARIGFLAIGLSFLVGCSTAGSYRENMDKAAYSIIEQKQMEAIGKTEPFSIEPPEASLRKKVMTAFGLPYSHPASLGPSELAPIDHWPDDEALRVKSLEENTVVDDIGLPSTLSLSDVLAIAAKNNRQYQSAKEAVFQAALGLELQRDRFRSTLAGAFSSDVDANLGQDPTRSANLNTSDFSVSKQLLNGISLTGRIGLDLLQLLNPFSDTTYASFGDASISVPLLRGAGRHIVAEPLTQAERDTVYAIYTFERFKRTFAVSVASEYLGVLRAIDQIFNAENNYRSAVTNTRLVRRLRDAGDRSQVEVDQAIQQELSSRNAWIGAKFAYERQLDAFKISLGLPPDATITLDENELKRLSETSTSNIALDSAGVIEETVPPADAPVVLKDTSDENTGPLEFDERTAIAIALENRLDLREVQGAVYDAQRNIVVAADRLRPELTLLGSANLGNNDGIELEAEKGRYNALLTLDLPLERTSEVVNYRQSIIGLQRSVRDLQDFEDSIKRSIRDQLRSLKNQRNSMQIQAMAVQIAERRVHSSNLFLQAGLSDTRDLLESQAALLESQNSLTRALVDYRIAELELQRDLGVLQVNDKGMWTEFSLEEYQNEPSIE